MTAKRAILFFLLVLLSAGASSAFTPESRVSIVLDAFKLMPPALRVQLEKHKKTCLTGTLEPLTTEGEAVHSSDGDGSFLFQKISEQTEKVITMIDGHEPFGKVIYEMGILAHYVTDLNFPLSQNGDGKEYYHDLARFCASKEQKIRVVFYGFSDPDLAQKDVRTFSERAMKRSISNIPYLKDSFERALNGSRDEFDDRSILFGIASLSYSHAVTDIARIWLFVWNEARGDLTGTPHLDTFSTGGKK